MPETDSRIIIDRLLREAGWDIENKLQVSTEEPTADGRADYLLKDNRGRPLAIIEAKRFEKDPNLAQEQAKAYAESINAPFIFLANGEILYFWDYKFDSSRLIDSFYSQEDLERREKLHEISKPLSEISMPSKFTHFNKELEVRPYQIKAIEAVDEAIEKGKRRMLIEMATGTGKTLAMAMIMKRLFEAGMVKNVLFLVDRKNLAEQTKDVFTEYLKDTPSKVWYGGKPKELAQIVIGTLPTIASQLKRFGPGYFDLVVTDECHRSIYNVYRDLLNHFDALHVGMTATPNLGHYEFVNEKEKRLVRNTYEFYKCWNHATQIGEPTFAYGIGDGIKDESIGKESFWIYDFVGNAEKFNDPMLENAVPGEKGLPRELVEKIEEDEIKRKKEFLTVKEADLSDEMQTRQMIYVGPEGLAIDRQN